MTLQNIFMYMATAILPNSILNLNNSTIIFWTSEANTIKEI